MDRDNVGSDTFCDEVLVMLDQVKLVLDHLINLQPHLAEIPEEYIVFIDPHIDEAIKILKKILSEGEG